MAYKQVHALSDYLIRLEFNFHDKAKPRIESKLFGRPIPRRFNVQFHFKHEGRLWYALFDITCLVETPILNEITFSRIDFGKRLTLPVGMYPELDYEKPKLYLGLQRWQTEFIARYQSQLFDEALLLALLATEAHLAKKKSQSFTLDQVERLRKQIEKTTRRKVTPLLLKQVGIIYTKAVKSYPPTNPIEAIMDHFNISHRRAQEYAKYARDAKYLLTPKQLKAKIKKKQRKKEGKK
jgi:hypothetical protein